MKTDIWMPLYVADYLADTRRLSMAQHGAYMMIIMDYWRNGPPPDDDKVLARIVSASEPEWLAVRESVKCFFLITDGKWTHGRIETELLKARSNKDRASEAGKASAQKRWGNRTNITGVTPKLPLDCNSDGNSSCNPSPSSSPSPSSVPATTPIPQISVCRRFVRPTIEELKLQGAKIGLPDLECEKFLSFYESKGWKVGKNPMVSWTHALSGWKINWQKNSYGNSTSHRGHTENNPRNAGIVIGPTDYAEAAARKLQRDEAERLARTLAADGRTSPATEGT